MSGAKRLSWQYAIAVFCILFTPGALQGPNEGDVRLDGPDKEETYEGRVDWFHKGVWISLCEDLIRNVAPVICRQIGYPGEGALSFYGGSYGSAPGETYRGWIDCTGRETHLSQCTIMDQDINCNPNKAVGVSCNNNRTVANTVRLHGTSGDRHQGRLELFINGVWGTVCRRETVTYIYNHARVVCRQLFGPGFGGAPIPAHETVSRFGLIPKGAIFRRLRCMGNETSVMDCQYRKAEPECTHEDDSGIECFPVPADCGGYSTGDTGTIIHKAGYNYTRDTDCVWTIVTTPDKYLRLTFQGVAVQVQSNNGLLSVVDGDGLTILSEARSAATVSMLPKAVQYIMFIKMHVIQGSTGLSFNASWVASCGRMYFSASDQFSSPGYYDNIQNYRYPPNVNCDYIIGQQPSSLVRLNFDVFQLDGTEDNCLDSIQVYDGDSVSAPVLGGPFCGQNRPADLTSNQNFVFIKFISDNITSSSRGFHVIYSSEEKDCGGTFNVAPNAVGHIHSPSFPGQYPNNANCVYTIRSPPPPYGIILTITQLQLPTCCDFIEIIDGPATDSPTISRMSSATLPFVVSSMNSTLRVHFTSGYNYNYNTGWNASYTASCDRVFTTQNASFYSPEYSTTNRTALDCDYHIRLSVGAIIILYVETVHTGYSLDACHNFFKVYDGDNNSAPLLGDSNCSSSPRVLKSTNNTMLIKLHVDQSNTGDIPRLNFSYIGKDYIYIL